MPYDPLSAAIDTSVPDAVKRAVIFATGQAEADPGKEPPVYGPRKREFEPTVDTSQREINKVPPLFCTLYRKTGGTRTVTVSEGRPTEVSPKDATGDNDSILEHAVTNIWDTPQSLLTEHAITAGQVVGVAWTVDEKGDLTSEPAIAVRDFADRKSVHNAPPVGPDPGTTGDCFYVLARLVGTAPDDYLEVWHGGSNIDYVHDTPAFQKTAGATGVDFFKKYNLTLAQYEYLGLLGVSPIKVELNGDNVEFSFDGDTNLDLEIHSMSYNPGTETVVYIDIPALAVTGTTNTTGAHTHTMGGGAETGGVVPMAGVSTDGILKHDGGGVTDEGGADSHRHNIVISDGGGDPYTTLVVNDHEDHKHAVTMDSATGSNGDHDHTVTGTTEVLTGTARPSVTIPPIPSLTPDTDYVTVCFRKGTYHSIVSGSGAAVPHEGVKDTQVIWVLAAPASP